MSAERISTLFPVPDAQAAALLDGFGRLLSKVHPLRGRHRETLPYGIRDLSRMLTDERAEMSKDYMGHPATRAAYLRYFLPWNLYRLVRLFQGMERSGLDPYPAEGGTIADLGSGPVTVPLALWIALPGLRSRKLRFVCVDRTPGIMRDGLQLLQAVAGKDFAWHVDLVKGPLHTEIRGRADLLVAANTLNELQWGPGGNMPAQAEKAVNTLRKNMTEDGKLLIIEPGTRRSGTIITHLRGECLNQGMTPLAPCPHTQDCPLPGKGNDPWCHFRLPADTAPQWLRDLSREARLPKNDTSLSFLLLTREQPTRHHLVRAVSGTFPIQHGVGQYACSEQGLVLLQAVNQSRSGWPGDLLRPHWPEQPQRDAKSGALILPLDNASERPDSRHDRSGQTGKKPEQQGSKAKTQASPSKKQTRPDKKQSQFNNAETSGKHRPAQASRQRKKNTTRDAQGKK